MSRTVVYVALQQFCEEDRRPLELLEKAGFEVRLNRLGRRLKKEEIAGEAAGAAAILAGVEPYDDSVLAALPGLKCISRCGVGTDAIDLAAAKARGVDILVTRDEVVQPVAQMTATLILALARNLPRHIADFREGKWVKRTGRLLPEWTIGLIGFGRIGRATLALLAPFGPRFLVCDPLASPASLPPHTRLCPLDELLAASDLVTLHADAGDGKVLLGPREIARMKPGAFLVNTARGSLVDESALHDALVAGRLAGAALDVFSEEPYSGPLARLPCVIPTPHVATLTGSSRAAMELGAARNAARRLRPGFDDGAVV